MKCKILKFLTTVILWVGIVFVVSCSSTPVSDSTSTVDAQDVTQAPQYLIGPGDTLQVFIWGNQEFSVTVPVRPDGKISTPLVEDVVAIGRTPTQLAREIEQRLKRFIKNPIATVLVTEFIGTSFQQIRIIGEASRPQAIPYRNGMTVLDVMIAVGGLTEFAAGNRAKIVRNKSNGTHEIEMRLDDLLQDGDITANVAMRPGDILIIPTSWF